MSHDLKVTAAQMEKEGFLVMKDTATIKAVDIMKKVCEKLKLKPPVYEANMQVAGVKAPGYSIQLSNWNGPVSINTETGELHFDNYSPYGPDHAMVKSGTKRVGEDGRWGNLAELDAFRKEYEGQLNHHLMGLQQEIANLNGHFMQVIEESPDRIVLEVEA